MTPNRTILSVPGHIEKMHLKASKSPADVIMLDLEDSVPPDQKIPARSRTIKTIRETDFGGRRLTVRINDLTTSFAYRDLIDIWEACGKKIDAVVIPKVETAGDIHFADRLLTGIEAAEGFARPTRIEACIETVAGMDNVSKIARASGRLYSLVFGIADYSICLGAGLFSLSGHGENEESIYPGHRWHFPLSRMIMAAKANHLLAIDATYGNFKDLEGLERSAVMGRALGCDGKWVIHPDQIPVVNRVFTPPEAEIQRAKKVVEAAAQARKKGLGAVSVDGRMIDQATLKLAQQVWQKAVDLGLDMDS